MGAFATAMGRPDDKDKFYRKESKYDQYDPTGLQAAAGQPGNAPSGSGQTASQGALPGGAPSGAASAKKAPAFSSEIPGEPGPESGKMGGNKDFFTYWKDGSDDEKKAIADEVAGPIEEKGMSLEGAAKRVYDQNPEMAKEVGAKYGITGPTSPDGMPEYKLYDQALLDYEDDMKYAEEQRRKNKVESRAAMGGFLFEMGLRILASNRGDAGGAIGEGALGTWEARKQRDKEAREEAIAAEDREYEKSERKERAIDRERARTEQDAQSKRSAAAEERAQAEEKRRQQEHEAKMKAGTLSTGARPPTAFEVQWGFYKEAYGEEDMTREDEQKLRQEFLSYYNRESRMSTKDREMMINSYIKLNDDNPDDSWFDLTGPQKRQAAIDAMGLEADDDADNDPLGLRD